MVMGDRVRLACVRRTASVHPELGSNSFKRKCQNYYYKIIVMLDFLIYLVFLDLKVGSLFSNILFILKNKCMSFYLCFSEKSWLILWVINSKSKLFLKFFYFLYLLPISSRFLYWWAWLELNQRPIGYEPTALTPELQARKLIEKVFL